MCHLGLNTIHRMATGKQRTTGFGEGTVTEAGGGERLQCLLKFSVSLEHIV